MYESMFYLLYVFFDIFCHALFLYLCSRIWPLHALPTYGDIISQLSNFIAHSFGKTQFVGGRMVGFIHCFTLLLACILYLCTISNVFAVSLFCRHVDGASVNVCVPGTARMSFLGYLVRGWHPLPISPGSVTSCRWDSSCQWDSSAVHFSTAWPDDVPCLCVPAWFSRMRGTSLARYGDGAQPKLRGPAANLRFEPFFQLISI